MRFIVKMLIDATNASTNVEVIYRVSLIYDVNIGTR